MDINCIYKCFYQTDGKCALTELPSITQSTQGTQGIDCPYYTKTNGSKTGAWFVATYY